MNNKVLGNTFERLFVEKLKDNGFWAHFIEPNRSGAQPFDVIAIRDGQTYVFDCKTSMKDSIGMNRLQLNQEFAFEKIQQAGCWHTYLAVLHEGRVYCVHYNQLKYGSVKLNENLLFEQVIR